MGVGVYLSPYLLYRAAVEFGSSENWNALTMDLKGNKAENKYYIFLQLSRKLVMAIVLAFFSSATV